MKVNYYDCKYCGNEDDEENTTTFPCDNPKNLEGDCPLNNKVNGHKAECKLID